MAKTTSSGKSSVTLEAKVKHIQVVVDKGTFLTSFVIAFAVSKGLRQDQSDPSLRGIWRPGERLYLGVWQTWPCCLCTGAHVGHSSRSFDKEAMLSPHCGSGQAAITLSRRAVLA